jgi:hypothetical protein
VTDAEALRMNDAPVRRASNPRQGPTMSQMHYARKGIITLRGQEYYPRKPGTRSSSESAGDAVRIASIAGASIPDITASVRSTTKWPGVACRDSEQHPATLKR